MLVLICVNFFVGNKEISLKAEKYDTLRLSKFII